VARLVSSLHWRAWDGDFAVYDDRSGDTHCLTGMPAELFERLATEAATPQELVAAVARDHDMAVDDALAQAVADSLGELTRLGLLADDALDQ
jgi:PqqD family protein of HPr-rel-A system